MASYLPFSIIVIIAVFVLIAVRKARWVGLRIWQIVLIGAVLVLITGQISLTAAMSYVDLTVIIFLLGIFIVGEAMVESGYLEHISYVLFKSARSVDMLVLLILFSVGFLSLFLLNDMLAIIGTPAVMMFASKKRINPKLMLLTLAFAITTGSVASPIGNPQNLLIATSGIIPNPFTTFFSSLILPTIINLFIAYLVLKLFYGKEFDKKLPNPQQTRLKDKKLAGLCKMSLALIGIAVMADILVTLAVPSFSFNLAYISVLAALPIIIFSEKRYRIFKGIDWSTIVFFIALFVLVGSVWQSGFLQSAISSLRLNTSSVPTVLAISVIGSQFVSNVPTSMLSIPSNILNTASVHQKQPPPSTIDIVLAAILLTLTLIYLNARIIS